MERLIKIGQVEPKHSLDVNHSKIGLGFEKLDRDVFDPEIAYDKVEELGIKWIRIQSGWQKTETEPGVYHFEWLDKIVDNLIARGLKPWICLCYGNQLYDDLAKTVFGAVGCPPIFTDEQRNAWKNYCFAVAEHYKGRVDHYEVWNEPDNGGGCWKTGRSGTQYGELVIATSKAVKSADKDAKIIGGSLCDSSTISYANEAFATGMLDYIEYISFHEYTHDETKLFERVKTLKALIDRYNPNVQIVQGESGSQSRSGGHGALSTGAWTEEKQAKQLIRHTIGDLMLDVYFTSYFSCMDMIEALDGKVGDLASYLDFGYFGVLGAEFDENGRTVGTCYRKKSYMALQNIASIFAEDFSVKEIPALFLPRASDRVFDMDLSRNKVITGGFAKENGEAFAYWYPTNIMTTSYEGTITLEIHTKYEKVRLVDLMDGSIYEIPESIMRRGENGMLFIRNLPIKDYPMLLTFGEF